MRSGNWKEYWIVEREERRLNNLPAGKDLVQRRTCGNQWKTWNTVKNWSMV
jgi:hypothetical protein